MRRTIWGALAVFAMASLLAACGSSGPDRGQLMKKLSASLQHSGTPADVSACIQRQARGLPSNQLQKVANAGSNPPTATKQIAGRLLASCIEQGIGVAALRASVVQSIRAHMSVGLPAAYTACVLAQGQNISTGQLSFLATHPGQGYQIGVQMGLRCLNDPATLSALRSVFVAAVARDEASSTFSAAFKHCVLTKAQAITHAQLQALLLARIEQGNANAAAQGQAVGRAWAEQCIASGIKP